MLKCSTIKARLHLLFQHMSQRIRKPTKYHARQTKTQISLGIRPVWSESSLSAWRKFWSLTIHWAHSEESDQTGFIPVTALLGSHFRNVLRFAIFLKSKEIKINLFFKSVYCFIKESQWSNLRGHTKYSSQVRNYLYNYIFLFWVNKLTKCGLVPFIKESHNYLCHMNL